MLRNKRLRALLLGGLIVGLVAVALVVPFESWGQALMEADNWRQPRGVLIFIALYVVWNFVFPPAPLQLIAGVHYGFGGGLVVIIISTSLANIVSHGVGRGLGRQWVADHIEESDRLSALEEAIDRMGWKAVVLFRLSNLIPSNLANLLMGVTTLKLSTILWATMLGSLPGWALMLGLGHGGRVVLDVGEQTATTWTLYIASAVVALILVVDIGRRAHKILDEKAEEVE